MLEIIDGEEVFEVEHILDSKKVERTIHYLIKWQNYDHSANTWEPVSNLYACELVKKFHMCYPAKLCPSCI